VRLQSFKRRAARALGALRFRSLPTERDFFLRVVDSCLLDGVASVIDEGSSLVEFGCVLASTEGTGGSASQGTVRVIPTVGKNFLQLTFPVVLGLFLGSVSVSTDFPLTGWSDGNATVEMVEF